MCCLFFLAAGIAPAAALPHCSKLSSMMQLSAASSTPHCKGMDDSGTDVKTKSQSNPSDPKPTSSPDSPHNKKGCCCDGDAGGACKTNCKIVIGVAALADAATQLAFENSFSNTKNNQFSAFIFEIITPPPKPCA